MQKKFYFHRWLLSLIVFASVWSGNGAHAQTTITRQISASTDDAEENLANGSIDRSSTDLEFSYDDGNSRYQKVGLRFPNLAIPQGATITNAYITFSADNTSSGTLNLIIRGQNADNAATFASTAYNLSTRPVTSASVAWSPAAWTSSTSYNTVNINSVVQEIVNRAGWVSGNALVLFVDQTVNTTTYRSAAAYDASSSRAPILHITYTLCSPGIGLPVFTAGSTSTRCLGANTVSYPASATNATGITYSLDAASLSAGNTINATNGNVTFTETWTGTSIITASASGCQGPRTATHTVTTTPQVGVPAFTGTPVATRCSGAGSVTYAATATNATSIEYSISNSGTGTAPTINATTGQVTYAADWSGTSTITATSIGCGTSRTNTFVVNSVAVQAVADAATGSQGSPLLINLTANDLCGFNNASLRVVSTPSNGTVQMGTNGSVTYLPNGSFYGVDTFTYEVCTGNNPETGTCSQATVTVTILNNGSDVCASINNPHTYYLPFPENTLQTFKALQSSGSAALPNSTMRSVTTIKANYPNTVIYYDHWEDSYEATAGTKTQTSTLVWGDGNTTNGTAPGYPTDIIPEGAVITLDESFAARVGGGTITSGTIQYDGRDKIYSTRPLTIAKVTGVSGTTFNVQNLKTNVVDINRFGTLFTIPFGENIASLSNPTTNTRVFYYVGVFARAAENGTIIQLDYNGDGVVDATSPSLNEGQVWFYDGTGSTPTGSVTNDVNKATDIKAGARLTSNKPIGVDLIFGGIDNYGTRNIALLPGRFYGDTYYSPVHTVTASPLAPTYAVFTNVLDEAITVNWQNGQGSSGTITIPALIPPTTTGGSPTGGFVSMELSAATGYKFTSTNGKSYTGVVIIDVGDAPVTSGTPAVGSASSFDWAFNMIPEHQLTSLTGTSWAPGNGNTPPTANWNPVWVTPTANTTVYVKYDGAITGTGGTQSPCGLKFDAAVSISALQSYRIFNPAGSQTGLSLYTCDGTKIAAVWGQDASIASTGTPAMDVGYVLDPQCMSQILAAYNDADTTFPNIPVVVSVLNNDIGLVNAGSLTVTTPPANGSVVVNSDGTVTYTPNLNYTGTDVFSYQVCNQAGTLCDVAQVSIFINCATVAGKNFISGKVFNDTNGNGALNAGETGQVHTVNLYNDANGNKVVDPGEALLQSVQSDNTGAYTFEINVALIAATNAVDAFTSASFSGGNGWASNWTEINDNNTVGTGDVRITGGELVIDNASKGAMRSVNLSSTESATFTFNYNTSSMSTTSLTDILYVQVGPSTSGPWTELGFIQGYPGSAGYLNYTIPTALLGETTTIRFITGSGTANDNFFHLDNVTIAPKRAPATVRNYVVALATPLPVRKRQTVPAGVYDFSFTGSGSQCNRHFGLADELSISGYVFNDANGLTDGSVNGVPYTAPIYATLVNAAGVVVASTLVNPADGSYSFTSATGVLPSTNYSVMLNQTQIANGTNVGTSPTATLPAGWVSTGEFNGTANETSPANGVVAVSVGLLPVTNVSLGIQQPPYAGEGSNRATNAGGTTQIPVPANTFSNTEASSDPAPGSVTGIRLTTFPQGAASVVINGITYLPGDVAALTALIIPTNANGEPTVSITADPIAESSTEVRFNFKARDNAGIESVNTGLAVLNLTTPGISGSVHLDTDGSDNINGTSTNGNGLFVNVIDGLGSVAYVATVGQNCDGAAALGEFCIPPSVLLLGNYQLQLSRNAGVIGSTPPATQLHTGWNYVGESLSESGNDGTGQGLLNVTLGTQTITGVRFGIIDGPLPVTLLSFTVRNENNVAQLQWSTATELNNTGFEVQRSVDLRNWSTLGFVQTKAESGNSKTRLDYAFTDATPRTGTNYYRLRQIDTDEKSSESAIRSVMIEKGTKGMQAYPNPAKDQLTLDGLSGNERIRIVDLSGRVLLESSTTVGEDRKVLSIRSLPEGSYMLHIRAEDGSVLSKKVIKVK